MGRLKRLFDGIFRDKAGKIVIFQVPNMALVTYFALVLAGWLLPNGLFRQVERLLAFAALTTWAVLEIVTGTSFFRRILGGVVLVATVSGALMIHGVIRRLL